MRFLRKTIITALVAMASVPVIALAAPAAPDLPVIPPVPPVPAITAAEELKIAAIESLISAPPVPAIPLLGKVLADNHSDAVKSRALFILSQIELPEAQAMLLESARSGSSELRLQAIRMIGVGGDETAMAGLAEIYRNGDEKTRKTVLQAYMIADDAAAIYEIAADATSDEEFEAAVHMLGAMGATNELHQLGDRGLNSKSMIHAYAIAEDFEALNKLARDSSDPTMQLQAIQGLGIIEGDKVNAALMEIYRGADREEVKRAALHGMMVAEYEEGLLELFRTSKDVSEKREMLHLLVVMESDAVMDIISATLQADQ